jgi:hypothetical protein
MPGISIYDRARLNLSTDMYALADPNPVCLISPNISSRYIFDDIPDQYILRMLISTPETGLRIPDELGWIESIVKSCISYQRTYLIDHPYIYLTVRNGIVRTQTDCVWHVDGFSMRKTHVPEQSYIWSNNRPTEVVSQNIAIPANFNALKHNLHWYIQENVNQKRIQPIHDNSMYLIDPYIIHRRPPTATGVHRRFFRISFVPIVIEDDRNTPNPLIPMGPFNNSDIRDSLVRYVG